MSTRAAYTFIEGKERHSVYKHHDGYPSGACEALRAALDKAWPLPRFEADEFAAAFVAANKVRAGGVYLIRGDPVEQHSDLAYLYEVEYRGGTMLHVRAYSVQNPRTGRSKRSPIFEGSLEQMESFAAMYA